MRHALPILLPALLTLAGCAQDESISGFTHPATIYVLREMNGAPFTARATIEFPEEGRIAGDGPCNRYVATQTVPYPWFSLTAIGATKRGCDDLAAETAFFTTLAAMTIAEVIGPVVKLRNLDGQSLVFDASADAAD